MTTKIAMAVLFAVVPTVVQAATLTCTIQASSTKPEQQLISGHMPVSFIKKECDPYELRNCGESIDYSGRDDYEYGAAPLTLTSGTEVFTTNEEHADHTGFFSYNIEDKKLIYGIKSRGVNTTIQVESLGKVTKLSAQAFSFNAAISQLVRNESQLVIRLQKAPANCVITE